VTGPEEVATYVRRIVETTDPDAVVLFGSRARGTHATDSDVDLLVVHSGPGLRRIQRAAYEAVLGHTSPLEIIVRTPEELTRRLAYADPFTTRIVREGRVLYGKPRSRGVALFS
jgi:predicted nucleotidyltransferase